MGIRMTETVMRGHGYYNAHSELQARSAQVSDPILERALHAATIPAEGPITIADFGCSQGLNSMRPMERAIAALMPRTGAERDFAVVHTDQPHNDFTSLFTLLGQGQLSYRHDRPNVFSFAIGRSFYEPLLPTRTLTFGWSAMALHWMSHLPSPLADHIWIMRGTEAERAAIAAVAAQDWRVFLGQRMRELIPGGQLVLVVGAADEQGSSGLEALQDVANEVLQALVAEGSMPRHTYSTMTIPSYARTRAELEAPLRGDLLPGLRLEEMTVCQTPNPVLDRWRSDGDSEAFGRDMAGFYLAAFSPSLFGEDQPLEALFAERLPRAIAADPARVAKELVIAIMRISRL
jgi:hypothetical protein